MQEHFASLCYRFSGLFQVNVVARSLNTRGHFSLYSIHFFNVRAIDGDNMLSINNFLMGV